MVHGGDTASFWGFAMAGGAASIWGHYPSKCSAHKPGNYPNPEQLAAHREFWQNRFRPDFEANVQAGGVMSLVNNKRPIGCFTLRMSIMFHLTFPQ